MVQKAAFFSPPKVCHFPPRFHKNEKQEQKKIKGRKAKRPPSWKTEPILNNNPSSK
jgi:hypothetical protein